MSWMSVSWSEHFCQDDDGGGASPELPEVEDADAAGVAAMATAARLGRVEEIARKKKAESSRDSPSRQGDGKLWNAREQGGHSAPPPLFKYWRPTTGRSEINGRIRLGRQSYGG